jgi:hypothetical protein
MSGRAVGSERRDPTELHEEGEAVAAAGPVPADDVWSGVTDHAAEDDADNDGIIGVAEDGDEVGDEIDG